MIFSEQFSLKKSWLHIRLYLNDWPQECKDFANVWINNSEQSVWKHSWSLHSFAALYSKKEKQKNVIKMSSDDSLSESRSW